MHLLMVDFGLCYHGSQSWQYAVTVKLTWSRPNSLASPIAAAVRPMAKDKVTHWQRNTCVDATSPQTGRIVAQHSHLSSAEFPIEQQSATVHQNFEHNNTQLPFDHLLHESHDCSGEWCSNDVSENPLTSLDSSSATYSNSNSILHTTTSSQSRINHRQTAFASLFLQLFNKLCTEHCVYLKRLHITRDSWCRNHDWEKMLWYDLIFSEIGRHCYSCNKMQLHFEVRDPDFVKMSYDLLCYSRPTNACEADVGRDQSQ